VHSTRGEKKEPSFRIAAQAPTAGTGVRFSSVRDGSTPQQAQGGGGGGLMFIEKGGHKHTGMVWGQLYTRIAKKRGGPSPHRRGVATIKKKVSYVSSIKDKA